MMLLRIGFQGTHTGQINHGRLARIIKAILYSADNRARIINWSGFAHGTTAAETEQLKAEVEYAAKRDVLIIISTGNDGLNLDDDGSCK
jgi:hypothetical protein